MRNACYSICLLYSIKLFIEFTLNVEDIIPNCRALPEAIVL